MKTCAFIMQNQYQKRNEERYVKKYKHEKLQLSTGKGKRNTETKNLPP